MISETSYRRIVSAGGWYDIVVTAPLATPWTFAAFLGFFASAQAALGAPGETPPYSAGLALFANLMGTVVLIWSVLRIRSPERRFGRYDAVGRGLFAIWMLYAVLHGANALAAVFLVPEIAFGLAQALPVRRD